MKDPNELIGNLNPRPSGL